MFMSKMIFTKIPKLMTNAMHGSEFGGFFKLKKHYFDHGKK